MTPKSISDILHKRTDVCNVSDVFYWNKFEEEKKKEKKKNEYKDYIIKVYTVSLLYNYIMQFL